MNMDVTKIVRRLRMHGFGLSMILPRYHRQNAGRLAHSRLVSNDNKLEVVLDITDVNSMKNKWFYIENLGEKDMFGIAFFRKFGKIIYAHLDKGLMSKMKSAAGHRGLYWLQK